MILWTAAHAKLNCVHLLKDIPNPCAKSVIFLLYRFQFEKICLPLPKLMQILCGGSGALHGVELPMHAYTSLLFCMRREAASQRIIIDNFALQFLLKKRSKGNLGFVHSFELRFFPKSWDLKHYCDCNNRSFRVHIDLQQWAHTPELNFVESQLSGSVSLFGDIVW